MKEESELFNHRKIKNIENNGEEGRMRYKKIKKSNLKKCTKYKKSNIAQ